MNIDIIEKNLKTVLALEWYGVRIEDTREENSAHGLLTKTAYYYSVPESSTFDTGNVEVNNRIQTADSLKLFAKEMLKEMLINTCKAEYGDDKEFIKDLEDDFSNYFKFYAKVRKGEVWSKELGNQRIKELTESIKKASGYKEV